MNTTFYMYTNPTTTDGFLMHSKLATTIPWRQLVLCHFDRETYKRNMGSLFHLPTFPHYCWTAPFSKF